MLLKGDIVVEEGVTLSILPGCEIRYFSGKPVNQTHYIRNTAMGSMDVLQDERIEIVVEGKLEAAGEPKKKIRFTGGKNSGGILFLSRTPGSKLTWAGFGDMPIALRCYGEASPDLENLDISDCVLGGIGLWDTASPLIKNCSIKNCGHGIGAADFSRAVITGNRISFSQKAGIFTEGGAMVEIRENILSGNNVGVACGDISEPKIEKNEISGNGAGIVLWVKAGPSIAGNRIFNNMTGIVMQEESSALIEENVFSENGGAIGAKDAARPRIRNNTFERNPRNLIISGGAVALVEGNVFRESEEGIRAEEVSRVRTKKNLFENITEERKLLNHAVIEEVQ